MADFYSLVLTIRHHISVDTRPILLISTNSNIDAESGLSLCIRTSKSTYTSVDWYGSRASSSGHTLLVISYGDCTGMGYTASDKMHRLILLS